MTLDHLQDRPHLRTQLALLLRLQAALAIHPACSGAAVTGSLATDSADALSDVDLIVYCESGAAQGLLRGLSSLAATRPVIHRLEGRHDDRSVFEKVILEDWSSYEIHVIEPSTRMRLRPPYLELVNVRGYLETRCSQDKPIGRATARPFVNGEDGLVWELFNCIKWLRRGDVVFARRYLQRLGSALADEHGGIGRELP
jgi:hypothetical protein